MLIQVNSTWTVENEPCKTMSCVKNTTTDEISLKEIIATCDHECKSVSTAYRFFIGNSKLNFYTMSFLYYRDGYIKSRIISQQIVAEAVNRLHVLMMTVYCIILLQLGNRKINAFPTNVIKRLIYLIKKNIKN